MGDDKLSSDKLGDRLGDEVNELIAHLKQERDELMLQTHLLKAELKDEWEEVEEKWQAVERDAERFGAAAKESAVEIGAAIKLVGEEIAAAYRKMRNTP